MDDWEYSDDSCPKCGKQMSYRRCSCFGCDDGEYLDEDGINGDEWMQCDECCGLGYEEWCRECGWDNVFKCFLSPKYKAAYEAKQAATTPK